MGEQTAPRPTLAQASLEVYPSSTIGTRFIDTFGGTNLKVNVTSSPNSGIDATIELTSLLAKNGFNVVPHIGVHEIEDAQHLSKVAGNISDLGIKEVFVIKGEGTQKGIYRTGAKLMRDLAAGGMELDAIGIGGYPEGGEGLTSEQMLNGIRIRKQIAEDMGAQLYVVTQMCFDPDLITRYGVDLKNNGIDVPLLAGLPNSEGAAHMYERAVKYRVGPSRELLLNQEAHIDFDPRSLVESIEASDSRAEVSGYHIYTFNKMRHAAELLGLST